MTPTQILSTGLEQARRFGAPLAMRVRLQDALLKECARTAFSASAGAGPMVSPSLSEQAGGLGDGVDMQTTRQTSRHQD